MKRRHPGERRWRSRCHAGMALNKAGCMRRRGWRAGAGSSPHTHTTITPLLSCRHLLPVPTRHCRGLMVVVLSGGSQHRRQAFPASCCGRWDDRNCDHPAGRGGRQWGHVLCTSALLVGLTCRRRAAVSLGCCWRSTTAAQRHPMATVKRRNARAQSPSRDADPAGCRMVFHRFPFLSSASRRWPGGRFQENDWRRRAESDDDGVRPLSRALVVCKTLGDRSNGQMWWWWCRRKNDDGKK